MESLHGKELNACWRGDQDTLEDDNFSEDDFTNKDKATANAEKWSKIWKDRVSKKKVGAAEEEEKEREKEKIRSPWRQEMADRRDPWRYYTLQGEAYVHGLMDGEAVSDKFYKQIPDHLFEIR